MNEAERRAEARRWLRYAREDLQAAEALLDRQPCVPRHICWLAQQGAEKALKAVLVFLQVDFPRSHDLDALRNLAPPGWQVSEMHPDLAMLSEWAVEARYPGDWPEATEEDARTALQQARTLLQTVRSDFSRHGVEFP
jgi:HEPN domain-containing protein